MIVCGLKLTHDGAVALIDNGRLVFSIEVEKLCNQERYAQIEDTALIEEILAAEGYRIEDIDCFAVDGWGGDDEDALAIQPRLTIGEGHNWLDAADRGEPYRLAVGQYEEQGASDPLLRQWSFEGLRIGGRQLPYVSYYHAAAHVAGAYCSSPFARRGESAYVLVWDGGMYPRLYYYDADRGEFENLGPIFLLIGNMYSLFAQHFGPFQVSGGFAKDSLSVAGKVMAYIALGQSQPQWYDIWDEIYLDAYDHPMGFGNKLARLFKERMAGQSYEDADVLRTFHDYLGQMLLDKLAKKIRRHGGKSRKLALAGGCALNIKWNSAIRESGIIDEVYVPPFPNDSGSAIGVACCAMLTSGGGAALDWTVYSGPEVRASEPAAGWLSRDCGAAELATLLHERGEPVVVLHGRAELGPRALGNRSIIAPAVSPAMKDALNRIKDREPYRPVSPICLEDDAPELFEPGIRDPYMLFDHRVKPAWLERIPAVIHLDGTARLQTVDPQDNPWLAELLAAYKRLSGIPVLCNTSANHKGMGFFPDVASATAWDGVNYVWSEGVLYERESKLAMGLEQQAQAEDMQGVS
ncbi:hypothetical protein PA598K_03033 [Paenibacillus sp. 598K]|uniref:carbamoyltransferase N-terminal domain-containing protein n=1 Tax=Paenibacillus sp. 598K TaxID=1117987 RepID=UPI000FFA5387|nr:carbamoyltransferase N-terminal domain-containing protein [Paenibacillus sp. 598K]GBF74674.1 hypothetical protein PA598K_03033 [Paenibacillus sp. 598K]